VNDDAIVALRAQIASDPEFARRLAAVPDDAFVDAALAAAADRGIALDAARLRAAIEAGRTAWLMRWLR